MLKELCKTELERSPLSEKDRYIIYRRRAGIGDLLLGLYYVWAYAKATKRQVIVDWRWSTYINTSENLFNYLFRDCYISGTWLRGEDIDKTEFPQPFYPAFYNNRNIHCPPDNKSTKIYEHYYKQNAETAKICCFFPYQAKTVVISETVRAFPYRAVLDEGIKNFMRFMWSALPPHIINHMKKVYSHLFPEEEKIIGVHIRLGNNDDTFVKTPFIKRVKGYHGQDIGDYIKQEILPVIKQFMNDHIIYISTDTQAARDKAQQLIPGCITYDKWFPPPGCEIHFSPVKRQTGNGLEILRDSLTEISLLSNCDKVYSTFRHSAFAKVAGLLNKRPPVFFM